MRTNDLLDPKTTTLSENQFYDLICEVIERDAKDGIDTVMWGCQLMTEYRADRARR